ncbi:MAG: ribonuclease H family protein [Paramuribaculum sp.]|nr:ribonuclease H family protein [Paramuribaculum sp.]
MGKKYYVVWAGHDTGVFDSWEECKALVEGFPNAKYKAFPSMDAAIAAYRGDSSDSGIDILKAIAQRPVISVNYDAFPEIDKTGIAVDAGCRRNPGPVEYRGVNLETGEEIFHVGPLEEGTNNLGEFLAIVHALALLEKQGRSGVTVYSDSKTAMAWVRDRRVKTTLAPTPGNEKIRALVSRAATWLATHTPQNHVTKWRTEEWGEIPADFGRKG